VVGKVDIKIQVIEELIKGMQAKVNVKINHYLKLGGVVEA